jgi:exodeoxyribonuclease III
VAGVLIGCLYLPNGNPQPGPKFDYKLAWFERLIAHAATLVASNLPVVLAGDYNVVPTGADIYPTRSWERDALLQPASRVAFRAMQGGPPGGRARRPCGGCRRRRPGPVGRCHMPAPTGPVPSPSGRRNAPQA